MRATLTLMAALVAAALSVGCGPSPMYEPEPRMPGGYVPANEPTTSEQLAAAQAAGNGSNANGEVALGADADEYSDADPSALTEFKPALEGHGAWVDDSTYGTIWVPAESEVGTDFVPYTTAGHWTYDDRTSWVWVSDYSWGWAPFHYGRWVHVGRHGWAWIPGRTYAGAWVVWRSGGPDYVYVGWAPAGPDWYWYNGYAVGWNFGYSPYYSYCHHDYLYDRGVGTYVVRGSDPRAREYEAQTRPYTPATPTVGSPGRVAATPTVGAGRTAASPRVGPRPSEIGVKAESVIPPPRGNAGLARAQAFASPHSAVAAGAAPPIQATRRPLDNSAVAASPGARAYDGRGPALSSRIDAVARAPQVEGVHPVPPRQSAMGDPRPNPRSSFDAPQYRSGPSVSAQPSQPAFGAGSRSASAPQPSSPSQSHPAFRSSPSVSAPSQPSRSPPPAAAFRSSPPVSQPAVRSAVQAPPMRSSPSVSSPSRSAAPSSPSRSSSAPAVRRGR